jgi:serralysin
MVPHLTRIPREDLMMKTSTIALVLALGFAGCATSDPSTDQPLAYDEFAAQAYYDAETGTYVINGDELVENEAQMHEIYDSYLQSFADLQQAKAGIGTTRENLIVNTVGGADDKWAGAAATHINYCISASSFGANYDLMKSAFHDATRQWERVANVNFIRLIAQDTGNCTTSNTTVVFNVRQVSGQPFLARAFFPSSSRSQREVLIDSSSFGQIDPFTIRGILRHELGHTIGFRHEHTRPESGTCFEDNNWRTLTAYDWESVMHYPQCNGGNTGNLRLTDKDKAGAAALYPGALSETIQPESDTTAQ